MEVCERAHVTTTVREATHVMGAVVTVAVVMVAEVAEVAKVVTVVTGVGVAAAKVMMRVVATMEVTMEVMTMMTATAMTMVTMEVVMTGVMVVMAVVTWMMEETWEADAMGRVEHVWVVWPWPAVPLWFRVLLGACCSVGRLFSFLFLPSFVGSV